jgi:hypothetical protein
MTISSKTEKHIWGLFAARCAMCKEHLIHDPGGGERSLLGEIAHVIGERPQAARGASSMSETARNEPDNLLLLCRKHHKIIDDNEASYSVEDLQKLRSTYLSWLAAQLELAKPWRINVSSFSYLNVPRLCEYAALQGFDILDTGPAAGQSLHDLGYELNKLTLAFRATLENISIASIAAERIQFAHEGYVGQLVSFDRLRFRTKNLPKEQPVGATEVQFTGDLSKDPHICHAFSTWTLVLNINPRWITTSTAYGLFRPSGGHSLFTGFARITDVDFESNRMTTTALAVGQPIPVCDIFRTEMVGHHSDTVTFEALEDSVSRSREDVWRGDLERCDFCGKKFSSEQYMVDGPMQAGGPWGCMCSLCYSKSRLPLGVGMGQLYRQEDGIWKLVGGYPRTLESDDLNST